MKVCRIYKIILFVSILLCVGCEEHIYRSDVTPSLVPRFLSVDKSEVAASSANAYSVGLAVKSENTPWLFEGYPSWLSLNPNQGSTHQNVSVNFTENVSADTSRYAIFSFMDDVEDWDYNRMIIARQPSAIAYVTLSQKKFNVLGAACQYDVEIYSNAAWRVQHTCSWISTEIAESSLSIEVQENNTGDYREAYIYVYAADCTETIFLSQAPANATVTEEFLSFSNQAASAKLSITSEASWYATVSASWIQITPESGTAGTTEVIIDVAPNVNVATRKGYVSFRCSNVAELLTMEIEQTGLFLEIDTEELLFDALECVKELHVNSNAEWVITSAPKWVAPSISKGSGNATISIRTEENPSTYERTGFLVLESPGLSLSAKIKLVQKGKTFALGTDVLEFSDKASTNTVDVITDGTWVTQCDADWITLSPHSASGNSTLSVSVTENIDESERLAIVRMTVSDKSIELLILQQGKYLSLDNTQLLFPTKGGSMNLYVATNDSWRAQLKGSAEWLKMSTMQGEGAMDVVLSATDNASVNERSDVLSITTKNNLTIELPIKQEARRLSVSVSDILFFSRGGTSEPIIIETNGEYKISQVGEWFTISRTGNTFVVTALNNNTKDWREGCITIAMTDLVEGSIEITIPVKQVQVGCSFTLSGFGNDTDQDTSSGNGNFTGNGFEGDSDWSASMGSVFTVSLVDFVADNNWDAVGDHVFTVTVTGYREENDWNNNASSDTFLGKDNFGNDSNQDNEDSSDTSLGKDSFADDADQDSNDSSDTSLSKGDFGNDSNQDSEDSSDTSLGKDSFDDDVDQDSNDSSDTSLGKDGFGEDGNWNE